VGDSADGRSQALKELGKVVAALPFDEEKVRSAVALVKSQGGNELMVEVTGTCAMFHCVSKVVDATGRQPSQDLVYHVMLPVVTKVVSWFGY